MRRPVVIARDAKSVAYRWQSLRGLAWAAVSLVWRSVGYERPGSRALKGVESGPC